MKTPLLDGIEKEAYSKLRNYVLGGLNRAFSKTRYLPGDIASPLSQAVRSSGVPRSIIKSNLKIARGWDRLPTSHVKAVNEWFRKKNLSELV